MRTIFIVFLNNYVRAVERNPESFFPVREIVVGVFPVDVHHQRSMRSGRFFFFF